MSFILDALRKSDAERQRQSAPGLADIRYARPKARRSPWVPLLVVVLVANLGFMAFQWWRSGTTPPPQPPPPAATPGAVVAPPPMPAAPAVPAAPVAVRPDPAAPAASAVPVPPEVRPLAVEADPAAEAEMELLPDPAEDEAPGGMNDGLAAAAGLDADALAADAELLEEPAAPAPRAPSRIREEAGLPTSQQLIAAGTLRVPELSLELHVFSDDPAGRFVIINGRRYREGATLNEGPKLESITAEGAVLDSQGTRFIVLPR